MRKGKGLDGEDAKFVPEKFLGLGDDPKWIASGKTDQNGMVDAQCADQRQAGVLCWAFPRLYRVEVTKQGLEIPAKYNTETILGQEVANDAAGIMEGIRFDLSFDAPTCARNACQWR